MIFHGGIATDIDEENTGKFLQTLADPNLSVLIIFMRKSIPATKECPCIPRWPSDHQLKELCHGFRAFVPLKCGCPGFP